MNNRKISTHSRKVVKFPTTKKADLIGDPTDRIEAIDREVFELLSKAKPIEEPDPIPITDEMAAFFVKIYIALVAETKGKEADHG
jgi:hypothetical protein